MFRKFIKPAVIIALLLHPGDKVFCQVKAAEPRSDLMLLPVPGSVKVGGYLGSKIDLVALRRIKAQDVDHLVEPFRHKEETRLWQSEFWGKWMLSAVDAYRYYRDPELLSIMSDAVNGLISTQLPSGYIGNYSEKARLQQWDIWGRKYTMLGLLSYYDITGDRKALKSAAAVADNLLTQVGPGLTNIVATGNYRGMASSSILEPMVLLYLRTGDKRYLDFSRYIVNEWEKEAGPMLISNALASVNVASRFPHPAVWWSYENGQKAYEMMSCYDGLLELYRITGEPDYLKAVEMTVRDIIENEINIAGSGSAFECFYNGSRYQTEPTYHTMETCVTMTWMKLCFSLLRLTGNPVYADQIERSAYNALMASLRYDGTEIAKYSPLGGIRHAGEEQCGMHINCCNANGPRAFMMLPEVAVTGGDKLYINLYGDIEAKVPLTKSGIVGISQKTDYPVSGKIEILVNPEKSGIFTVALRIPVWSTSATLQINGEPQNSVSPGTYYLITRKWNSGDKLSLNLDMGGRVVEQNNHQAVLWGPVVLARDTRLGDGFVYESVVLQSKNGRVALQPASDRPGNIWMVFTAPMILGTDLEGAYRNPRQVKLCDFASAGNTWSEESRYRVWLPKTLNVMKADYKAY